MKALLLVGVSLLALAGPAAHAQSGPAGSPRPRRKARAGTWCSSPSTGLS